MDPEYITIGRIKQSIPAHQVVIVHLTTGKRYMIEVYGHYDSATAAHKAMRWIGDMASAGEDGYDPGYYAITRSWLVGKANM